MFEEFMFKEFMIEEFMVEELMVEDFMVEKLGLKLRVEKEMRLNCHTTAFLRSDSKLSLNEYK